MRDSKGRFIKGAPELHSKWKGGRHQHGDGYIQLFKPGHPTADNRGRILEHRFVMEQHLGRLLEKHEIIHHKNEDKKDNRIENLEITTRSSHVKIHSSIGVSTRFQKGMTPWNKQI